MFPLSSLRLLIKEANLFDESYYVASYREELAGWGDPLDHFIATGQYRGYKPNPFFDPLVYLVQHPDAKEQGALRHYLENRTDRPLNERAFSAKAAFPSIAAPNWARLVFRPPELKARDLRENLALSHGFGEGNTIEFQVHDETYRLYTPSADEFFERLSAGPPCAFPRLPHGFWDCLVEVENAQAAIARLVPPDLFSEEELGRLACRLFDEMMPEWGLYSENFLPELLGWLQGEANSPSYLRSVSFRWHPTADNRLFNRTEEVGPGEIRQLEMFAGYFAPDKWAYESMVWKRWSYSGDLKRLPPLARQRPVVLVGANRVNDLDRRWKLPWFAHVEIEILSYGERYAILDQCKEAVIQAKEIAASQGTKPPFILLQGGSFAYWLIARLHAWDPTVFYLDLGQSLHIWFLDDPTAWSLCLTFHPRLVMENCELDEFYRNLGAWLEVPFADVSGRFESIVAAALRDGRWSGCTCARDVSTVVLESGWHPPEPWGVWSDGGSAQIRLPISDESKWHVVLTGVGFVSTSMPTSTITARMGTETLARWTCTSEKPSFVQKFELRGKGCTDGLLIDLEIPGAIAPAAVGVGTDQRCVGIGLQSVEITRAGLSVFQLLTAAASRDGKWAGHTVAGEACAMLLEEGWHGPEWWGTWSDGGCARMRLPIIDNCRWRVLLAGHGFVAGSLQSGAIQVRKGGVSLCKWTYGSEMPSFLQEFEVESDDCAEGLVLEFDIPNAASPAETGAGTDARRLGIGLRSVEIERCK